MEHVDVKAERFPRSMARRPGRKLRAPAWALSSFPALYKDSPDSPGQIRTDNPPVNSGLQGCGPFRPVPPKRDTQAVRSLSAARKRQTIAPLRNPNACSVLAVLDGSRLLAGDLVPVAVSGAVLAIEPVAALEVRYGWRS